MADFNDAQAYGSIPGRATQASCPDCGCRPHRDMTKPKGNKECPQCGCPDLITAKKERDGEVMDSHFPTDGRNTNPGFSSDGVSYGTSVG